ncbi:MAG: hypothetical protein DRP74_00615 [Candidatus Omnitrophota bacterium]|nr:MAG: hypothetical protein DRP74_00615 [Candidatus Omnitrophota bacterium]
MQAVILAGGQGTRLRPLTYLEPKPMIRIGVYPFLEYVIRLLKKNKIANLVICTGYLGGQIKKYFGDGAAFGVNIEYSHEVIPAGTGGSLKLAKNLLGEDFFIVNGDTYLDIDYLELYKLFKRSNRLMMMVVCEAEKANCKIGQRGDLIEYSKLGFDSVYIDAGVSVMNKGIFNLFPDKYFISFEKEVLPKLISERQVKTYVSKNRFYDIGTFSGLQKFKKEMVGV